MKHPKPRRGQDYRPQPGTNTLADNFQYDISSPSPKLAEIARSWGLDPDSYIGQTADGKLQWSGPDESNGVAYDGGANTTESNIPKPRKLSNPMPGMDQKDARE